MAQVCIAASQGLQSQGIIPSALTWLEGLNCLDLGHADPP